MNSTLTNEEREAILLEERERERENAKAMEAAYAYFLAVKYEMKNLQNRQKLQKEIFDSIVNGLTSKEKKELPEEVAKMAIAVEVAERSSKKMQEFFKVDLSAPENEELKEDLAAVDVSEDQFSNLAFCACGEDMDALVRKFDEEAKEDMVKESGQKIEFKDTRRKKIDYDKIRDQGILQAKEAISSFKKGDPKLYAKILGDAMLVACTGFAKEPSDDIAMQWSIYTEDILKHIKGKKELIKNCGLTEKHFAFAEKVTSMGKTIKGGLKAVEKLNTLKVDKNGQLENSKILKEVNEKVIKFKSATSGRESLISELYSIQQEPKIEVKHKAIGK